MRLFAATLAVVLALFGAGASAASADVGQRVLGDGGASADPLSSVDDTARATADAAVVAAAAPAGYPITGIDVSAFQGSISWPSVVRGGALFAYIRASEQANIADPFFRANYQAAKAGGLFAGAYHRARPNLSGGRQQAAYFLDQAGYTSDGRTLPPMLDIEWPRTNWTDVNDCYDMTPAQLTAWIRDFVDEVRQRTGRLAMIYTNANWWRPCTDNNTSFASHPLFIASYTPSPPPLPGGWQRFTLWQYADAGALPGDQDVFNGDYSALIRLAGGIPRPVSLYAHANARYVTAENAGRSALIANRTRAGGWERFHEVDVGGGFIALRANVNGRFVTAESAGAAPLIANRTVVGSWERFTVVGNSDGSISLRASVNGRYVTAENAGAAPLIANRTAIGRWERFDRISAPVVVSLLATVNDRYVTAGSTPLIANATAVGAAQRFDLIDLGRGRIALRAQVNGRFVTAESAGSLPLIANRTAVGSWETFAIVDNADGTVALTAMINGRYVAAENAGRSPLIANRTAIGSWEKFRLIAM